MVSVILHGALGFMGRVVDEIIAGDPDIRIVAGVDITDSNERDYPIYSSFGKCTEAADAIIDFSTAKAVDVLVAYAVERNIPAVICTTGLSEKQTAMIKEASEQVAVLRSGNMSLGINLLIKLLKEAAETLSPAGFDTEILEMHHRRKLDAPSGTALMLADAVREGAAAGGGPAKAPGHAEIDNTEERGEFMPLVYDRNARRGARPAGEIGMSTLRGGTIVGTHDVYFAGQDEVIEIKHTATSRAVFAKGAVQAAKFLAGKGPGLYTMADVIG